MKKIVLITAIVLISSYSFGQLGFGIKGAFTMNTLSTDLSDYEKAAKTGFQAGAFVRIGKKLHLQPEAYFAVRSGELTAKIVGLDPNDLQNSVEVKQGMTLSTIDIPILIGYKIFDPPTLNVRLQAGPVISMVVNKKFDLTLDGVDAPEEVTNTLEDDFKNANWGLQFGAGVDFLFLTVDVRYELGLSDLYEKSEANPIDFGGIKNNIFFVSVGWKIL
ncbi:MAG: hypothetical protein B6D61_00470 [Bacteroidetes bacterium 4484_249]|nr:MAG: hypothetical protein B6D61_00470 [Bacteroidetes bacterium 4484_249]